jgi:hypothetical protein
LSVDRASCENGDGVAAHREPIRQFTPEVLNPSSEIDVGDNQNDIEKWLHLSEMLAQFYARHTLLIFHLILWANANIFKREVMVIRLKGGCDGWLGSKGSSG